LRKKVTVLGTGSRPERGSRVTIRYREALSEEGDSISQDQEIEFNVGESEVIQALDLVVPLMNIGEEAIVQVISVVDPNPKESESFGWIRIRTKSSDSDRDPDTVVE
jgi:FK506-binding protein 8